MNKKEQNNKGFSLVELIIVIAIMAILVGVLAPQFIKFVEKSRESTDLQNVEEMKTALETYVADTGDTASYTVTCTKNPGSIVCSCDKLGEYGIDSAGVKTKSKEWDAAFVWTYSSYKWELTTPANGKYLKADGTEVTKTTE